MGRGKRSFSIVRVFVFLVCIFKLKEVLSVFIARKEGARLCISSLDSRQVVRTEGGVRDRMVGVDIPYQFLAAVNHCVIINASGLIFLLLKILSEYGDVVTLNKRPGSAGLK